METRESSAAGAEAVGATTVAGSGAPAVEAQNEKQIRGGLSFATLSQASQRASVVTPACRSFIESLNREATRLGMSVETVNTGTVSAQVVFYPNNRGVALVFANGSLGLSKRSASDKIDEVINAFRQHGESCKNTSIVTGLVIDETSYDRAELCADAIYNTIKTVQDEDNDLINVDSFKIANGYVPMVVSTKPEIYREYVRAVSPFGFAERDDIGFLVGFPKQNCPATEKFDIKPETHTILFAVTGYTQFVRIDNLNNFGNVMNNLKTIQPVVHITSIISDIPSMVMLPPAVTIAAQTFIAHRNWMRPYMTINGKESMNVGNLVINTDASGNRTTMDVEAPFQAEQVMEQTCAEPILCLDITIGRYGIPGIECIFGTKDRNGKDVSLANILAKYYREKVGPNAYSTQFMACPPIIEYTGSMNLDNQVLDSRCGDYLRMFKKINDYNQVCCLLSQPNDPSARLQQLSDLGITVRSLYKTQSIIFTLAAVKLFADICPPYELDLMNDARFNHSYNGIAAAAGISGLPGMAYNQPSVFGNGSFGGPFTRY